jgi:hypothetical protein
MLQGFIKVHSEDDRPVSIHWTECKVIKAVTPTDHDHRTLIVYGELDRRDKVFCSLSHAEVEALIETARDEDPRHLLEVA